MGLLTPLERASAELVGQCGDGAVKSDDASFDFSGRRMARIAVVFDCENWKAVSACVCSG